MPAPHGAPFPLPSEPHAPPAAFPPAATPPSFPAAAPPVAAIQGYAPTVATSPALSSPPPAAAVGASSVAARISALQSRVTAAIPPRWLEVARERPVLWMVGAPVLLASLFVLPLVILEPPHKDEARPESTSPSTAVAAPAAVPAAAPAAAPASETSSDAKLAELEAKPASALSVEELLLLSDGRAERKRRDAEALSRKLKDQPDVAKDPAVQVELMRLVADPDTAHVALGAMAQARSTVGADLLYEVWTNRSTAPGTAELARTLLYSRDVRPAASPALAATLELRGAETCEAAAAALPHVQADADRRSLPWLSKLNARRGCGPQKADDCYSCLRAEMKQVTAAVNGAKKRPAPSFPTL